MKSYYDLAASLYRKLRIKYKRLIGYEPAVEIALQSRLLYFGNDGYGGWAIPYGLLTKESVIVDIGLGEDISFSEAIILRYGCVAHGFDPTPKSIAYVQKRNPLGFHLHKFGVAGSTRKSSFYLPRNSNDVSASITKVPSVGNEKIDVDLINLDDLFKIIDKSLVDLLKIDIEGAEYELLDSESFANNAARIGILCIEFHHRWPEFGPSATLNSISRLESLGFKCVWRDTESNEEFTFLNTRSIFQTLKFN